MVFFWALAVFISDHVADWWSEKRALWDKVRFFLCISSGDGQMCSIA